MKAGCSSDKMFALSNNSFDDSNDYDYDQNFFNQTETNTSMPTTHENDTDHFTFDIDWIPSSVNQTDKRKSDFIEKVEIYLLLTEIIFVMIGIALQCLVIFFERFGGDSQKRGLINRLVATSMEWNILFSFMGTVAHIFYVTTDLSSSVAFALWFIRLWTLCGFYLSVIECCIAYYIIKVVYKRLILLNDELLASWAKLTNFFVGLFLSIAQSKSIHFVRNVASLSANSPSLIRNFIMGTNTRIPAILGYSIFALFFIISIHICINKYKEKKNTPVLQINILPNPDQPNQGMNQPQFLINNQAYNNDLIKISAFVTFVFLYSTIWSCFLLLNSTTLKYHVANYFNTDVHFFETVVLFHVRKIVHSTTAGIVPLLVIVSSADLRPFLIKCLKCSDIDV